MRTFFVTIAIIGIALGWLSPIIPVWPFVLLLAPFLPNLILNRVGKQFNWWVLWDLTKRKATLPVFKSDVDWAREGRCPNCHSATLLGGPSGGMCQNTACDTCHEEFNIMYGLGTGPFKVDRSGPLSVDRARLFGITPEEMAR